MNFKSALISSLAIISSQLSHAGESFVIVPVCELEEYGISPNVIQEEFYNRYQVNINWDEYLKVSTVDEGKEIRFEKYDDASTSVSIDNARGVFNKGL